MERKNLENKNSDKYLDIEIKIKEKEKILLISSIILITILSIITLFAILNFKNGNNIERGTNNIVNGNIKRETENIKRTETPKDGKVKVLETEEEIISHLVKQAKTFVENKEKPNIKRNKKQEGEKYNFEFSAGDDEENVQPLKREITKEENATYQEQKTYLKTLLKTLGFENANKVVEFGPEEDEEKVAGEDAYHLIKANKIIDGTEYSIFVKLRYYSSKDGKPTRILRSIFLNLHKTREQEKMMQKVDMENAERGISINDEEFQ